MLRLCSMLVCTTLCLATVCALAQDGEKKVPPPERGRPGSGPFPLLQIDEVKKELTLNDQQKEKLEQLIGEAQSATHVRIPGWKSLSKEERRAKLMEANKGLQEKMRGFEKRLGELLTPEQSGRLRQIRLQFGMEMEGPPVLLGAAVSKALDLSDEQRDKIKQITKDLQDKLKQIVESVRALPQEERAGKIAEVRDKGFGAIKESLGKAVEVLTPEQREKLEKMRGNKFDVDWPSLMTSRRPPREPAPSGRID